MIISLDILESKQTQKSNKILINVAKQGHMRITACIKHLLIAIVLCGNFRNIAFVLQNTVMENTAIVSVRLEICECIDLC